MEAHLVATIHSQLGSCLYESATFLAERLVASFANEHNVFLLATCYRHCNQTYRAYHLLKACSTPQARYLLAVCCLDLDKLQEAETALLRQGEAQVPNGAAGHYLLGRMCQRSGCGKQAAQQYSKALQKDPLLWSAYEQLCALGYDDLAAEFAERPQTPAYASPAATSTPMNSSGEAGATPGSAMSAEGPGVAGGRRVPLVFPTPNTVGPVFRGAEPASTTGGPGGGLFGQPQFGGQLPAMTPQLLSFVTPSPSAVPAAPPALAHKGNATSFPGFCALPPTSQAGARTPVIGRKGGSQAAADEGGSAERGAAGGGGGGGGGGGHRARRTKLSGRMGSNDTSHNLRRSARLAAHHTNGDSPFPNQQGNHQQQHSGQGDSNGGFGLLSDAGMSGFAASMSGALGGLESVLIGPWAQMRPAPHATPEVTAQLSGLMGPLKDAVRHQSAFRCREALAALQRLPRQHYSTGWVLCAAGRASFEMVDYAGAAAAFEAARRVDPYRIEGMEAYSTVLWHLKREVDLAHLAHECLALDRLHPVSWCVAGNCLSLQREHEGAIKLFQRALQLDQGLTYAYTLVGHECLAGEDFDAAVVAYRNALRIDSRHYNALYGIGQIFFRQEKYEAALTHFRAASTINPASSVLRCYCGMALHKLGRLGEALMLLQDAISNDPRNPLARYERANVLMSCERYAEALLELQALGDIAPREASVHFLMGKLHKRLGNLEGALACLNAALDLQPSAADASLIKSTIEKIHVADEDEDEEL